MFCYRSGQRFPALAGFKSAYPAKSACCLIRFCIKSILELVVLDLTDNIQHRAVTAICTNVTTVTTPGETVDVVITDYGIAINPRRQDLIECMKDVKLPFCTIEELRDKAYAIVGEPDPVQFGDRVVGIIESRDGTVLDVVREIKDYEFKD